MRSLIYHLKLSLIMKIHFIILIIQLKFILNDNLYKRFYNINLFLIKKEIEKNVDFDFVFKYKFYKIE